MFKGEDQHEVIALALGSNLGDRLGALRAAVVALGAFVTVRAKSAVYETPPAYVTDQPAFLNAALLCSTSLSPVEFLPRLKETERKLGRVESFQNGPRLIDLDLLFYGDRIVQTPDLILPHPRLAEREFVLRPLADIAPAWMHPEAGKTVANMLAALPAATARRIEENL